MDRKEGSKECNCVCYTKRNYLLRIRDSDAAARRADLGNVKTTSRIWQDESLSSRRRQRQQNETHGISSW